MHCTFWSMHTIEPEAKGKSLKLPNLDAHDFGPFCGQMTKASSRCHHHNESEEGAYRNGTGRPLFGRLVFTETGKNTHKQKEHKASGTKCRTNTMVVGCLRHHRQSKTLIDCKIECMAQCGTWHFFPWRFRHFIWATNKNISVMPSICGCSFSFGKKTSSFSEWKKSFKRGSGVKRARMMKASGQKRWTGALSAAYFGPCTRLNQKQKEEEKMFRVT